MDLVGALSLVSEPPRLGPHWAQRRLQIPPSPLVRKARAAPRHRQQELGGGLGEVAAEHAGGLWPPPLWGFQFLQLFRKAWKEEVETQSFEIRSVVVFLLKPNDPHPPSGLLVPFKSGPQ